MAAELTNFSYRGDSIVRPVFIETGTSRGASLENARQAGFDTLHSIEVYEPMFRAAEKRFADYPNVHLHFGSSPLVLPQIIDPAVPTTFWLDAHFLGGNVHEFDPRYGECPLLAELAVLFSFRWEVSPIVLIDDAHMFDERIEPGFAKEQWPTIQDIRKALPVECDVQEDDGILYCMLS